MPTWTEFCLYSWHKHAQGSRVHRSLALNQYSWFPAAFLDHSQFALTATLPLYQSGLEDIYRNIEQKTKNHLAVMLKMF